MKPTRFLALPLLTALLACSSKTDDSAAPSCSGSAALTLNAVTTTQTDGVTAVLVGGKFMGLVDNNLDIKIGDSESMDVAVGTTKNVFFRAVVGGVVYARNRSSTGIQATITAYDGTTLSGTYRGTVYRDGDSANPAVPVSGSFTTTCLQKM